MARNYSNSSVLMVSVPTECAPGVLSWYDITALSIASISCLVSLIFFITNTMCMVKFQSIRTSAHLFVFSLTFSDMLFATICLPIRMREIYCKRHTFTWCVWSVTLNSSIMTSSVFHIVVVSIDRLLCIAFPLDYQRLVTKRRSYVVILLVYLTSSVIFGITFSLQKKEGTSTVVCQYSTVMGNFYGLINITLFELIPIMVVLCIYSRILVISRRHAKQIAMSMPSTFTINTEVEWVPGSRQDLRIPCNHYQAARGPPSRSFQKRKESLALVSDLRCCIDNAIDVQRRIELERSCDELTQSKACQSEAVGMNLGDTKDVVYPDRSNDMDTSSKVNNGLSDFEIRSDNERELIKNDERDKNHKLEMASTENAVVTVAHEQQQTISLEPDREGTAPSIPDADTVVRDSTNGLRSSSEVSQSKMVTSKERTDFHINIIPPMIVEKRSSSSPSEESRASEASTYYRSASQGPQRKSKLFSTFMREYRTVKLVAVIVGQFIVCVLPIAVVDMVNMVSALTADQSGGSLINGAPVVLCIMLVYLHPCSDAVLYTLFNKNLRKAYRRIWILWFLTK